MERTIRVTGKASLKVKPDWTEILLTLTAVSYTHLTLPTI